MNSLRSGYITVLLAALVTSLAAYGGVTRELTWENLLPRALLETEDRAVALQKRLVQLPKAKRALYEQIRTELTARAMIESGEMTREELSDAYRDALGKGESAAHPDIVAYWAKVKQVRAELREHDAAVETTIDGTRVRIPGYVLPLELEGDRVREFLLVPYVGACIHTPPPPANQMVFVRVEQPFPSKGLFAPVWVEGTIHATGGVHELFLTDGASSVNAGYTIDALAVSPYEERR